MTEYHNVLDNPSLAADLNRIREYHRAGDDAQLVYSATGWMDTYVAETRPDSLNEIMGSFNVPSVVPDAGLMTLRASYKSFLVRFKKMGVPVKAGQKYLLKLTAWPKLRFHNDAGDLSTVRVRGVLEVNNVAYPLQWKSFDAWMAESPQELVWSVQTHNSTLVTLSWEVWSVWGNIVGDIAIEKLEMLEIGSDWQGIDLEIGKPGVDPTPIPVPNPTPQPPPQTQGGGVLTYLLAGGMVLAILIVLLLLFRSVGGATAQAVEVNVRAPITLEEAATGIIILVLTWLMSMGESLPVQAIVNFLKTVLPFLPEVPILSWFKHLNARSILIGVSGIATVLVTLALRLGFNTQLNSVFDWLIMVLPPLTNFITVIAGSMGLYKLFKAMGLPFFGHQRTP